MDDVNILTMISDHVTSKTCALTGRMVSTQPHKKVAVTILNVFGANFRAIKSVIFKWEVKFLTRIQENAMDGKTCVHLAVTNGMAGK